jgi:8-oxo-dGTP pyrophosphatase MutT (NUDIX family)
MGRVEYWNDPAAPRPNSLVPACGVLTADDSDQGHIVAYSDGEVRQEWELIFLGRPVSGTPTVNDEASDVRWVAPGDLEALDIHPTQWRQLRDWLTRAWPHVD